jgi:hypothetical protein
MNASITHLDLMAILTIPPSVFEIPPPGGTLGARLAAREAVVAARGHGLCKLALVLIWLLFDAELKN